MIKRFVFASSRPTLTAATFEASWLDALSRKIARTPAELRPLRAAVCCALEVDSEPTHAGLSIEWFPDIEALRREQTWEREQPSASGTEALAPGTLLEVIAQEVVLRGADWLTQRWLARDTKLKHMALARRAPGLTAAQFSERWRSRPGQIGGQTQSLAIPDAARGSAYCQNHPLPDAHSSGAAPAPEPIYDAINEVYFDRLEDMRPRIEFFRDQPVAQLDADLVSEPRFVVVRERLVDLVTC